MPSAADAERSTNTHRSNPWLTRRICGCISASTSNTRQSTRKRQPQAQVPPREAPRLPAAGPTATTRAPRNGSSRYASSDPWRGVSFRRRRPVAAQFARKIAPSSERKKRPEKILAAVVLEPARAVLPSKRIDLELAVLEVRLPRVGESAPPRRAAHDHPVCTVREKPGSRMAYAKTRRLPESAAPHHPTSATTCKELIRLHVEPLERRSFCARTVSTKRLSKHDEGRQPVGVGLEQVEIHAPARDSCPPTAAQ